MAACGIPLLEYVRACLDVLNSRGVSRLAPAVPRLALSPFDEKPHRPSAISSYMMLRSRPEPRWCRKVLGVSAGANVSVGSGADSCMEIFVGHSQIAVTTDVYAPVLQGTQREAVSHLDRLLKRRPGHD